MLYFDGRKVKAILALKGIKQKALAEHLGIKSNTLCKALHGRFTMTADRLARIAEFLDVSLEEFYSEGMAEGDKS